VTSCARRSRPPTAAVAAADGSAGPRTARSGTQRDAGQDRRRAQELKPAEGIVEGQRAHRPADQRLQIDEGPGELGRDTRLPKGEEDEGQERAREGERECGGQRRGPGQRRGQALEGQGDRQSDDRPRPELHGRDRRRIATGEQPRLSHDESGGAGHGEHHEQVALERRVVAASSGDERHACQREAEARPGHQSRSPPPERRVEQRHENRCRTDDQRRVGDAGLPEAQILDNDHKAIAAGAPGHDRERERATQPAPGQERQWKRGEREADHGEPGRIEPFECQLRQRDGEAPEQAGGDQGGES
jgi:hypothetical protein